MRGRLRSAAPLRRRVLAWAAVLFAGATLARALLGEMGLLELWRQQREAAALAGESRRLRSENDLLRAEIRALRGDPRAVEGIAREQLGFARPDEVVILSPRPGETAGGSPRE
jgi:cell division protein FtsB